MYIFKCNNFKGLTGYFGFDKNGNRKTYKLEIYETTWRRPLFKVIHINRLT